MKEALAVQRDANAAIEQILKYGVLTACKEVLRIGGLDYGTCRAPFIPLDTEKIADLENAITRNMGMDYMK